MIIQQFHHTKPSMNRVSPPSRFVVLVETDDVMDSALFRPTSALRLHNKSNVRLTSVSSGNLILAPLRRRILRGGKGKPKQCSWSRVVNKKIVAS